MAQLKKGSKGSGRIMAIILILALVVVVLLIKKTGMPTNYNDNNQGQEVPITEPDTGNFPTTSPADQKPPTTLPPGN